MSTAVHTPSSDAGSHGSDAVADIARRHPSLVHLARAGWVAKGVVYLVLGLLAASLVVGGRDSGGEEVSQTGAVAEVAEAPLGGLALWAVAAGLVLYVLWRLISILLPAESSARTWATRAGYAVSAAVYIGLAWTAVSLATGRGDDASGGGGQESQVDEVTRSLMEMTGGRWLVGLVGAAVIALGAYFAHRGWSEDFADDLEPGGVGPVDERTIRRLGTVGWIGRGVMTALVGWFVLQAALQFDPQEAQGLDGALRESTGSTIGAVLVALVAVGLVTYGAFCVISAPRTRLHGAD
jgi:hypothetical protein